MTNILTLGARAVIAAAPAAMIGADVKVLVRRLQDIEAAARSLDALGVSPFDDELRTALDEASGTVSDREAAIAKTVAIDIAHRFGSDSRLEPIEGEDAANLLVDVLVEQIADWRDPFVTIDGVRAVAGRVTIEIEGDVLEISSETMPTISLPMRDMAAIAMMHDTEEDLLPGEILMRDGRYVLLDDN